MKSPIHQRGAALLVALLIAALVTVTLTMMLQRQSALAGIEWQLRETAQARRILHGAEDWALLILREDARRSQIDHLGEPWAIPLQEGRLADFLKDAADAAALNQSRVQDVWLSGRIVDADARYNLMRLTIPGAAQPRERALWLRISAQAELPAQLAREVMLRYAPPPADIGKNAPATAPQAPVVQAPPLSLAHLIAQVPALAPWAAPLAALVVVLPDATTINVNTASRPVLMALMPGLDEAQAERFMDLRRKAPWRDLNMIGATFADKPLAMDVAQAGVASRYFFVTAQVRLAAEAGASTVVNMTTLLERLPQENRVRVVRRDFGVVTP